MARRSKQNFAQGAQLDIKLSTRDVWLHFEPGTAERGFRYFEKGYVLSSGVFPGGHSSYGKVQGSEDNIYEVSLGLRERSVGVALEGVCSCPVGRQCKHAAALAFQLLENSKFVTEADQGLPPNAKRWISVLKQTMRTAQKPAKPAETDEYLAYVISFGSGWQTYKTTYVQPTIARKLKRGGLGADRSVDFYSLSERRLELITPDDKRIIDCFLSTISSQRYGLAEIPDEPELAKLLFQRMLSTGRMHYQSVKNPALVAGPTVLGGFEWEPSGNGTQTIKAICLEKDGAHVLWSSYPWYVDVNTWETGPVEMSMPFEVADTIMSAPPVEPGHATAFSLAIKELGQSISLPAPAMEEEIEIVCPRPTPVLTFRERKTDESDGFKSRSKRRTPTAPTDAFMRSAPGMRGGFLLGDDQISRDATGSLLANDGAVGDLDGLQVGDDGILRSAGDLIDRGDARLNGGGASGGYVPPPAKEVMLTFDYGGVKFDTNYAHIETRQKVDGKTVITKRNLYFEDNCIERLRSMDFSPMGPDPDTPLSTVFSIWTDTSEYWIRSIQKRIVELEDDGWRIVMGTSFGMIQNEGGPTFEINTSGLNWFWFELGVDVDGERISLLPILQNILFSYERPLTPDQLEAFNMNGRFYAPLNDGRIISIPFERIRSILLALIEVFDPDQPMVEMMELSAPQAVLLAEKLKGTRQAKEKGNAYPHLLEMAERLKSFSGVANVEPPKTLNAELRDYQRQGLNWLQFLRQYQLGGLLSDDMGLGKTVQTIAHILKEKEEGRLTSPCLIICPTSVLPNWMSELEKFAPSLKALKLHGSERADLYPTISDYDIVLTTYALLIRDDQKLAQHDWYIVALDEAQYIKNKSSTFAKSAFKLKAHHRICLTGTPIENHLGELWTQFNFLMPGALGDYKKFSKTFKNPIEKKGDADRQLRLNARIRPFLLRRTKHEVAKELPEKFEVIQKIELETDQRDLYETIRLSVLESLKIELETKGFAKSQIYILDALLKLRQICCDPRLLKLDTAGRNAASAKLIHLTSMITEMIEEGRKILLFSQFTSMLDLIVPILRENNIPFATLRGDTVDRVTPVRQFQEGKVPLFLVSLKAGGIGLNLTAADTVIHYDPWWNPAVENQATDRAYRIGQDKNVFVYKLIAADTVEERMLELQRRKRLLAEAVYSGADTGGLNFTEDDLALLFGR